MDGAPLLPLWNIPPGAPPCLNAAGFLWTTHRRRGRRFAGGLQIQTSVLGRLRCVDGQRSSELCGRARREQQAQHKPSRASVRERCHPSFCGERRGLRSATRDRAPGTLSDVCEGAHALPEGQRPVRANGAESPDGWLQQPRRVVCGLRRAAAPGRGTTMSQTVGARRFPTGAGGAVCR